MRVRTIAFPFVGAAGGALAGGAFGLLAGGLWALAGAPDARALDLASWALFVGTCVGALMGACRALDRWFTEPGTDEDAVGADGETAHPFTPVRVFRVFVEELPTADRISGGGPKAYEAGAAFPVSDRPNKGRPPSRR